MRSVVSFFILILCTSAQANDGVFAFVKGDRQCPQILDLREGQSEMLLSIDQETLNVPIRGARRDSIRTPNFQVVQNSQWIFPQEERLKGEEFAWEQEEDDLRNLLVDFNFSEKQFSSYIHYTFSFVSEEIQWSTLSLVRSTPESDQVCEYSRAL